MTNEELLDGVLENKRIEKETQKMMEGMYDKSITPDVDMLIGLHEKKIRALEMSKVDPQIEAMKMKELRREVVEHMVEKQMSDDALDHRLAQDDLNHSDARGMV